MSEIMRSSQVAQAQTAGSATRLLFALSRRIIYIMCKCPAATPLRSVAVRPSAKNAAACCFIPRPPGSQQKGAPARALPGLPFRPLAARRPSAPKGLPEKQAAKRRTYPRICFTMWLMSAARKLNTDAVQLSQKPPLGEKRPRLKLVWENPKLSDGSQKAKSKSKPDSSYGRVLYNYFRYYDPSTGRYLTSDPVGLDGGMNTYLYANANPLYWIDPLGLAPDWVGPTGAVMSVTGIAIATGGAVTGNGPVFTIGAGLFVIGSGLTLYDWLTTPMEKGEMVKESEQMKEIEKNTQELQDLLDEINKQKEPTGDCL